MALPPLQVPLGVFPQFYANQPTTLVLKERFFSVSGDDFSIQTDSGFEVVHCQGKVASLSGRKEFTDPQGNLLFTLRKKHLSFPKQWFLEDTAGQEFLRIEKKFSIGKAKMNIFFKNKADGRDVELNLAGDFFDRRASITMGDVVVATIARDSLNARNLIGGQQTYFVQVAPGMDLAIMGALCVGLDEAENDGKKGGIMKFV